MQFSVRHKQPTDAEWIRKLLFRSGADFIVSRGRKLYPVRLPGFCAVTSDNEPVGLATYEIMEEQCELVTLDAVTRFSGVGTALVDAVTNTARKAGCRRLWLITTNDNIEAVRFYQRRDFRFTAVHVGALNESRKIKPSIPKIGCFGIPMRDELEFELIL